MPSLHNGFNYEVLEESENYVLVGYIGNECMLFLSDLDCFLKEKGWEVCFVGDNTIHGSYIAFKKTGGKNERT